MDPRSRVRRCELFVAVSHGGGVEGVGVDAGAQHVDTVQGGLGVDGGLVAVVGEPGVGDGEVEVLAHLELSADLADCDADLVGAGRGTLADALGDAGRFPCRSRAGGRGVCGARSAASAGLRQAMTRSPG